MTDSAVLARLLDEMEFFGLIKLKPNESSKLWSAIERIPQAEDKKDMKVA